MSTKHKLRLGSLSGRNANTIFVVDGKPLHEEDPVLHVYGIPLHVGVEDLSGDRRERYADAFAFANEVVCRWNSHDALVQALRNIHIQAADAQLRTSYQRTALEQISELAQKALAQVAP